MEDKAGSYFGQGYIQGHQQQKLGRYYVADMVHSIEIGVYCHLRAEI
jgi:hypothetical protein